MLEKYTNLWKTKKALEQEENIELREEIIKYYWPKTWKRIAKINWKDLADRVFSEYVRLYYADDEWFVECCTCWMKVYWTDIQNWHFESRWELCWRFDIDNCHPQCYTCNVIKSWNYKAYTLFMIDTYGREFVDNMENNKQTCKYSQQRYEENILERYTFIKNKKMNLSSDNRQDLSKLSF